MKEKLNKKLSKKVLSLFLFVIIIFLASCSEKKIEKKDKTDAMLGPLKDFFTAPISKENQFTGLWLANKENLRRVLEKQFLSQYKAKPDEASKEVLLKKAESMNTYLRIGKKQAIMLSISPEGHLGQNSGWVVLESKNKASLLLEGAKKTTSKSTLIIENESGKEKLIYIENDSKIIFDREKRTPEELASIVKRQLKNLTELPEY